jgi:hypothetical protein
MFVTHIFHNGQPSHGGDQGRGPYQGLLVLHPLNERNIYANIKKLGKQKLVGSVTVIVA